MDTLWVEVYVTAMARGYDFRLAAGATAQELVEEISEMVCQREQCQLAGNAAELSLWRAEGGVLISPGGTLAGSGVQNGDRLILV